MLSTTFLFGTHRFSTLSGRRGYPDTYYRVSIAYLSDHGPPREFFGTETKTILAFLGIRRASRG